LRSNQSDHDGGQPGHKRHADHGRDPRLGRQVIERAGSPEKVEGIRKVDIRHVGRNGRSQEVAGQILVRSGAVNYDVGGGNQLSRSLAIVLIARDEADAVGIPGALSWRAATCDRYSRASEAQQIFNKEPAEVSVTAKYNDGSLGSH
jgi:hypothetical protein